jgi:hypothetical protein
MESWMPLFVIVTAVAVVLQAIILISLFIQLRRTAARVEQSLADINTRVSPILSRVQILVDEISPHIGTIVSDASDITRMARGQAYKVDHILSETMERLRVQLIHVDQLLTGAIASVEQTGSRLRQAVWGPVVRATALVRGIQAGIEFFRSTSQGREPREQPAEQQDKGMFI